MLTSLLVVCLVNNKISKMIKFKSLNENAKFLEILKKRKINTKYFTIYFSKNSKKTIDEFNQCLNISFVMKKKLEIL